MPGKDKNSMAANAFAAAFLLLAAADPLPPQTPQPREDIVIRTDGNQATVGRDESGDLIWNIPPAEPRNPDKRGNSGGIIVAPEIVPHDRGPYPQPRSRPGIRPVPQPGNGN